MLPRDVLAVHAWSTRHLPSRSTTGIPLDKAALVGCGVTTGWGSAVNAAEVQPGETVVVVGLGGIGMNAVQGAAMAGARYVIAVDPVEFKREQAADLRRHPHRRVSIEEATALVGELTWGAQRRQGDPHHRRRRRRPDRAR